MSKWNQSPGGIPPQLIRVARYLFGAMGGKLAIAEKPLKTRSALRQPPACARGVCDFLLLLQRQNLLRSGGSIRMVLMHGIFQLGVILLHMLFVLLLVQLVLVLR